jgi:NAD(P)-dependent dehydrogenase (short-subunit alcohol dehydrogenase family)
VTALLAGKVAIVTGAAHGIGRGHALELARHGARVVVNDRGTSVEGRGSGKDADATVDLIRRRGGEAVADYGDVSEELHVAALVARALDEWGRIDVVVNNAGIGRYGPLGDTTVADFDAMIGVHLKGTWLLTREVARLWFRRHAETGSPVGGRVINTASRVGLDGATPGSPGQALYGAAKGGIVGLTLTSAAELRPIGVTVNAVAPGGLTRMAVAAVPGHGESFEPDTVPEGEFNPLDPSVSSPFVAWLAGDEAAHVTGQVFRVMFDTVALVRVWEEPAAIRAGGRRWDPAGLGDAVWGGLYHSVPYRQPYPASSG